MAASIKELFRVNIFKTIYMNYKYLQWGGGKNFTYICIQQHPFVIM